MASVSHPGTQAEPAGLRREPRPCPSPRPRCGQQETCGASSVPRPRGLPQPPPWPWALLPHAAQSAHPSRPWARGVSVGRAAGPRPSPGGARCLAGSGRLRGPGPWAHTCASRPVTPSPLLLACSSSSSPARRWVTRHVTGRGAERCLGVPWWRPLLTAAPRGATASAGVVVPTAVPGELQPVLGRVPTFRVLPAGRWFSRWRTAPGAGPGAPGPRWPWAGAPAAGPCTGAVAAQAWP